MTMLLTGCSSTLRLYKVAAVDNNSLTVTDGEFLYSFDGDSLGPPVKAVKEVAPIQPIESYGLSYTLTNIELSKYSGAMKDAAAYFNRLVNEGFTPITLLYTANTLDAKLSSASGDEIRIIYLGNNVVRILFRNIYELNIFPPYINEGE